MWCSTRSIRGTTNQHDRPWGHSLWPCSHDWRAVGWDASIENHLTFVLRMGEQCRNGEEEGWLLTVLYRLQKAQREKPWRMSILSPRSTRVWMPWLVPAGSAPLTWEQVITRSAFTPGMHTKPHSSPEEGVSNSMCSPFGLCNAPATFERLMDLVMSGLNYESLLVYLVDIIVFSETLEVHLVRLELVFLRLEAAGLKLKASKCHIMQQKVCFWDTWWLRRGSPRTLTRSSWSPNGPRHVIWKRSGLLSAFVLTTGDMSGTLREWLNPCTGWPGNVRFQWTPACEAAFVKLKLCLTTAPVLALPTDDDQYLLDTDASDVGLGGRPVQTYWRRGEAGRVWQQAVQWNGAELQCEPPGVARCDLRIEDVPAILARTSLCNPNWSRGTPVAKKNSVSNWATGAMGGANWGIWLHHPASAWCPAQQCRCHVATAPQVYEPILNEDAETASDSGEDRVTYVVPTASVRVVSAAESQPIEPSLEATSPLHQTEEMSTQQSEDSELRDILRLKSTWEVKPSPAELIACSGPTKAYAQQWDQLFVEKGVLFRHWIGPAEGCCRQQVVLPQCRRQDVIRAAHAGFSGGHFGLKKTLAQVQRRAYWVGWTSDVRLFCLRCAECAKYHRGAAPKQGTLTEFRVGEPMERWGIDLTGPHPTSTGGHKNILTAID